MIRPATLADLAAIEAVEDDAGARFEAVAGLALPPDVTQVAELGEAIDAGLCLVWDEGGLLGFVYGSVVDDSVFIEELSVVVAAAGRGLGAQLIDALAGCAEARGLGALTLTTFREVPWNAPYYRRLGFVDAEPTGGLLGKLEAERSRGFDIGQRVAMRRARR